MRLHVTDHAIVRMGDWQPDLKQFVPRNLVLDVPQAQGVLNALHVFLAGIESGRPSTCSEKWARVHRSKYHRQPCFIFDRPLQDLYTFSVGASGVVLVTFTSIGDSHATQILDDLAPQFRFSEVDEIRLPYVLNCALQGDPEFLSIRTPAGREIPLSYDIDSLFAAAGRQAPAAPRLSSQATLDLEEAIRIERRERRDFRSSRPWNKLLNRLPDPGSGEEKGDRA